MSDISMVSFELPSLKVDGTSNRPVKLSAVAPADQVEIFVVAYGVSKDPLATPSTVF